MATVRPGVWGIDLGQCALKALRLELVDNEATATAFDYIEHPKILSQPDADPDQLTRAALEQFLSRNKLRGDQVAISVPGQTGLARFVKLPPVEAKKIPDIVKFEAKQQIPFPLDEVVWDWQTLSKGGDLEGFVENEIGLFAMKRDMVNRYLQAFKDVGIEVHVVQMAPLALCNFVAYDILDASAAPAEEDAKNPCVVALDIGADNTNLVVTDGGKIIWQRPIPIGGNHFTRALTKDLKLTFAKAEHLKRNATKAEDPKKIFQTMKPVFTDFVGELQRSLGFFTNTHRDAQIKHLMGLGNAFRLPGLQKYITQSLNIELEKLSAFQRMRGDEVIQSPVYAENVLSFAVPYGLALQGLGVTRISTNLLPHEIQVERLIRAKKPWAAAAAASLFLGVTVFAASASSQFQKSTEVRKAAEEGDPVIQNETKLKSDFTNEQNEMKKAREAAATILRGNQERANWALIHRYINDCLPQADGSNLPRHQLKRDGKIPLQVYWTENARRAFQTKKERDEEGKKDDIDTRYLIQVNTQGIFARFCDRAMAQSWFNNIKTHTQIREDIDDHPDWTKPPERDGWAMEVRGFTNHDKTIRFVMDTFVENLRTRKWVAAPLNDPHAKRVKLEVSHVAILFYDVQDASKPLGGWKYITGPIYLNSAVGGTGGGGGVGPGVGAGSPDDGRGMMSIGGGGGGAGPGAPGPGGFGSAAPSGASAGRRSEWKGLSSTAFSGGGGGGFPGFGGFGGPPSGMMPGSPGSLGTGGRGGEEGLGAGSPDGGAPGFPGSTPAATPQRPLREGDRKRTEFIVMLYWVEPLLETTPVGEGDILEGGEGGGFDPDAGEGRGSPDGGS